MCSVKISNAFSLVFYNSSFVVMSQVLESMTVDSDIREMSV